MVKLVYEKVIFKTIKILLLISLKIRYHIYMIFRIHIITKNWRRGYRKNKLTVTVTMIVRVIRIIKLCNLFNMKIIKNNIKSFKCFNKKLKHNTSCPDCDYTNYLHYLIYITFSKLGYKYYAVILVTYNIYISVPKGF